MSYSDCVWATSELFVDDLYLLTDYKHVMYAVKFWPPQLLTFLSETIHVVTPIILQHTTEHYSCVIITSLLFIVFVCIHVSRNCDKPKIEKVKINIHNVL